MNFDKFKEAVANRFSNMSKHNLFQVDMPNVDIDVTWQGFGRTMSVPKLWETYLKAFPPGSDPIFQVRSTHDCSDCRHFIRDVGSLISINENYAPETIWDVYMPNEPEYQAVAEAMAAEVRKYPIRNVFVTENTFAGAMDQRVMYNEKVEKFTHFFVNIPAANRYNRDQIGKKLSDFKGSFDVAKRGFTELTAESFKIVLELIDQDSLYRGQDYKGLVSEFYRLYREYGKVIPALKDNFIWAQVYCQSQALMRVKNTAIGLLLEDLSKGVDLESSVKRFEQAVAPANYKRPKALVTQAMVDKARERVEAMGLTSALSRRYATSDDIPVQNVLFVDRDQEAAPINNDVFDAIPTKSSPKKFDRVEKINARDFLDKVVPSANSVAVLFETKHIGRLMSLTTAVDPTANRLFRWDNNIAWSYNGDFTDSVIKERVKNAGGKVDAELCCRLSWYNKDDLDLHMKEPRGSHIYFSFKRSRISGGRLDVDMNAHTPLRNDAVENIYYDSINSMPDGTYSLFVNQFNRRSKADVGFTVEIDLQGSITTFVYDKEVAGNVDVANIVKKGNDITIVPKLPSYEISKNMWNINTGEFHKVRMIVPSPNCWGGNISGMSHLFFILKDCWNSESCRGFYNEFLHPESNEDRKVLEILGARARTEDGTPTQLSGLGFSDGSKEELTVRVSGAMQRIVKVVF